MSLKPIINATCDSPNVVDLHPGNANLVFVMTQWDKPAEQAVVACCTPNNAANTNGCWSWCDTKISENDKVALAQFNATFPGCLEREITRISSNRSNAHPDVWDPYFKRSAANVVIPRLGNGMRLIVLGVVALVLV